MFLCISLVGYGDVFSKSIDTVQCDDEDIQPLIEEMRGPLEVCSSKRWATVCYNRWFGTVIYATVACRQLGFDSGKRYGINHAHVFR